MYIYIYMYIFIYMYIYICRIAGATLTGDYHSFMPHTGCRAIIRSLGSCGLHEYSQCMGYMYDWKWGLRNACSGLSCLVLFTRVGLMYLGCYQVFLGMLWCCQLSAPVYERMDNCLLHLYLLLCLHDETISDLLLRRRLGFARAIANFSDKHKSHCREPQL